MIRISHNKFNHSKPLPVDYLILSEQCNPDTSWLKRNFNAKHIILDSSIPFWRIPDLRRKLKSLSIPIYDIQQHGAFIIDVD